MKRFLLASFVSFLGLCSYAQDTPQITLTAEVDGQPRTFELGSALGETNVVTVDWGDGNVVEGVTLTVAYDGDNAMKVTGTPVGEGRIRIFATGGLSYFDCVSKVDASGITALDVSRAVELIELAANGNKLTTLDLSKNVKLTKARLGNNALAGVTLPPSLLSLDLRSNRLTSFDGTQVPQLQTLYLSNNTIERLDLSQNTTLKSIYLLDMGLKSFKLGANTTNKLYVSVNGNKLTTLDVTEATGLATGRLFAVNNDLQELKYSAIGVANLSGNRFTLATLPVANITTLTYAPQQPMAIGDIIGSIDLSAQNNIQGFTTTYTWSTLGGKNLEPGTDYTEEAGVFTFLKEQADSVYCVMSTEAFPKFTGANAFRTTAVPMQVPTGIDGPQAVSGSGEAETYSLDGILVRKNATGTPKHKGIYVIRRNGKTSKTVVK